MPRRWVKQLLLGLIATLLLGYSTMYSAVSVPNERSRLYLAVALVDHGTIAINEPAMRFGPILDTATFGDRLLSDKAPGSSFLGAALYGGVRLFSDADAWSVEELILLMRRGLMLPLGLLGFFALRALMRRTGVAEPIRDLISVGWLLGSSAFHYSTAYYGHQIVAVACIVALLFVIHAESVVQARPLRGALLAALAGAAAGLAGFTEYQAGVPAALLSLYVLFGPLGRRTVGALGFAVGALPFLIALGWYNTRAFGGPLQLSYHHLSNPALASIHGQGIGGITEPSFRAFRGAFFSLHRGLFVTSPMFVFAIPGVVVMWRRGRKRLALLLASTTLYFGLFIVSSNMWVAGWGFGPRLLVPAMGWMALLTAFGAQALHRHWLGDALLRGAVVTAVLYHQLVHAFFPEPPNTAENPILDVVVELARARLVAPNLVQAHLPGLWSLLPLAAVVAGISAWLLFRRMRIRRLVARLTLPLASLALVGLLLVYVRLAGPAWNAKERKDFTSYVRGLSYAETRGESED